MIRTENLTKRYTSPDKEVTALDKVSFELSKGSFTAIVGNSGSGKSTLLNILGLLDKPDSGKYYLDGKSILGISDRRLAAVRRDKIGFIFQNYNLLPKLSALENVELGLTFKGKSPECRRKLALAALDSVGLSDRAGHLPAEMSGGQQQRVAIARAIADSPALILADEPTGNLDQSSAATVMDLLEEQNKSGVTVLMITHSQEIAARAKCVYRMKNGILTFEDKYIPKGTNENETGQNQLLS